MLVGGRLDLAMCMRVRGPREFSHAPPPVSPEYEAATAFSSRPGKDPERWSQPGLGANVHSAAAALSACPSVLGFSLPQ